MTVDTEPQEVMEEVLDAAEETFEQEAGAEVEETQEAEPTTVPLSALQKERKKRQEVEAKYQRYEIENQYLKEQHAKPAEPPEEDESLYESVTKGELQSTSKAAHAEIMRDVEERMWIKGNSERAEYVNENLENFLSQRPNLASAIKEAPNRYEEAYTLMQALSPKQRKEATSPQKRVSPGSPTSVPKAAAMNQAVDVMTMDDAEFRAWRTSKRR